MTQESDSKTFSFCCAFDDAGDVGHDEALMAAIADDAEVGYQSGEGVVGDFGFGR